MKTRITVILLLIGSMGFAQHPDLSLLENYFSSKMERQKNFRKNTHNKRKHSLGDLTFVTDALKYQIDSMGVEEKLDPSLPYDPVAVYGYSFDGFGNDLRVTEERRYEFNPSANDYSGAQTKRRMIYNGQRQLLTEILETKSGTQWSEDERTEFTYTNGRIQTAKVYLNNSFAYGDSLSYSYDSINMLKNVRMFTDFGGGWERSMEITDITYLNGLERSMIVELDPGFGSVQPFLRFSELEWDFGYYPIVSDLIGVIIRSYQPGFSGTNYMELPSNAKLDVNIITWTDFQKIETISHVGNDATVLLMMANPPGPLDTNQIELTFNANGDIIYSLTSAPSNTGVGYDPVERDSVIYDSYHNVMRYVSAEYDPNSTTYNNTFWENYFTIYDANGMPTEVEHEYYDGFSEYFRFTIFGGQVASISKEKVSPFRMYPNPCTDFLIVESENLLDAHFEIIDMQGKSIKTGKVQGGIQHRIDLPNLATGQYIVKFSQAGKMYPHRLIIK
ncbi:MAG: T9SS type A sorting domain-containing protein [Cryomorphaceae bacterium]|nr:T9SS type A sorting domain-containing protein [Cryomorphaceae bacterium]